MSESPKTKAYRSVLAALAPFREHVQREVVDDVLGELEEMRTEKAARIEAEIADIGTQLDRGRAVLAPIMTMLGGDAGHLAAPVLEQIGWEPRWIERAQSSYRTDKAIVDDCVAAYLDACAGMCRGARGSGFAGIDGMNDAQAVQLARVAWAQLRTARVFAVGPAGFGAAFTAAHRFTYGGGLGEVFDPDGLAEDGIQRYIDTVHHAAEAMPFPTPLPFDSVFLSYGRALRIDDTSAVVGRIRHQALRSLGGMQVYLYGHLLMVVGEHAHAVTLTGFATPEGRRVDGDIGIIGSFNAGANAGGETTGWDQPMTMDPWIITTIVRAVNSTKTVLNTTTPGLVARLDRKRTSRIAGELMPLPSPYYVVHLKDAIIDEAVRTLPRPPKDWSHRWDVRGHECVRVARGALPLAPKDKAKLERRGYRVYEDVRTVTGDDAERLRIRGIARGGPNDWVAVLAYWRDNFVKGPPDKPYVPAVRR